MDWDIKRLQSIINHLGSKRQRYTTDDIISTFQKQANEQSLFNFMQGVIAQLQQMGKQRTSETYRCTLKSFMQFREDKDVLLEDVVGFFSVGTVGVVVDEGVVFINYHAKTIGFLFIDTLVGFLISSL